MPSTAPFTSNRYRQTKSSDIAALVELVNTAYRPITPSDQSWTHEADLVAGNRINFEQMTQLFNGSGMILVISAADQLIACAHIELQSQWVMIGMLSVSPHLQAQGLGRAMLEYAEHYAQQQWSIKGFKMSVITQRTRLIEYYQRRGYQRTAEFFDYPTGLGVGDPKQPLQLEYLIKVKSASLSSVLNFN